ncbi:Calpain-A, partial [Gryllus bimaculatus]
ELVNKLKPQLFVNGASDKDVTQGSLGDCWFLSVAAVVARYPHLIQQVIPGDQSLSGSDYTGLIAVRFWNLGKWTTVYIDDNLPVDDDDNLVFGQCTRKGEFWLPLLEKAFA